MAGGEGFVVTQFDLSMLIRDMLKMLRTSIPQSVKLELAFETAKAALIEADATQIRQIVMNLVINGAESIGPEEVLYEYRRVSLRWRKTIWNRKYGWRCRIPARE